MKIEYPFEKGGPKRLKIQWKGTFQDITVELDGEQIGTFDNREHFLGGQEFTLTDGSMLSVRLPNSGFSLPVVEKDGQRLSPCGHDPEKILQAVYKFLFMIAAANITIGILTIVNYKAFSDMPSAGWWCLPIGILFGVLGYFVKQRSKTALAIATGFFALNFILTMIFAVDLPKPYYFVMIVLRVGILFVLLMGFGAIKGLRQEAGGGGGRRF
ncbi:hypothetical protein GF406_14150 [candidate division KSB1 bacterium]|nr:hypothetical protein [candidate division KSB1 bacterium]